MSQNDIALENIPTFVCDVASYISLSVNKNVFLCGISAVLLMLRPSQVKIFFLLQAFSAFYFVMNFLNLTSEQSPVALDKVASAIESFCARPWHEVSSACGSGLGLPVGKSC